MAEDPDQLRRDIERTRDNLTYDVSAVEEKVRPRRVVERRVGRITRGLGGVRELVMGGIGSGSGQHGPAVTDRAEAAREHLSHAVDATSDAAGSAASATRRQAQGNPLAAGLIAFGVGWLVSSLLPASRQERGMARSAEAVAAERGRPLAQEAASQMRDNLTEPAKHAAESVRAAGNEAASSVKEEARHEALGVRDDVKEARNHVQGASSQR